MTAAEVKTFFRTVIKVVAGGPAVGTPGQNRAAGLLAALDKVTDLAAAGGAAPNVPIYAPGTTYPAGYLVSYGQPERFYRSKLAGQLPAPAGGDSTDANWLLSDPPPPTTVLSQATTLAAASYLAQHPEYAAVKSGLTYDITGPWNGGAADQVVSVEGTATGFATSGTLLSGGVRSTVTVDVAAGTAVAPSAGAGTVKTVDTLAPDANGNVSLPYLDIYIDATAAPATAVLSGTFQNGELQGPQPAGSQAG